MEKMVEVEPATQDEPASGFEVAVSGRDPANARDGVGGGVEGDGRSATIRAGRQPEGPTGTGRI